MKTQSCNNWCMHIDKKHKLKIGKNIKALTGCSTPAKLFRKSVAARKKYWYYKLSLIVKIIKNSTLKHEYLFLMLAVNFQCNFRNYQQF